ncbi:5-formyltetrahydrofolate cyclo-ligase [uncultured Selenomonas sp.]|uniref:5-formyltetrahydrofolate cyclo-ligase n=1 Tax=uncultured Selenomonas sp. TaxID=159275 RepID=UPI0025D5D768|nr:5-formyltetrahydrofolate cyclo-ligase [uncultured Selenomonas sp.]
MAPSEKDASTAAALAAKSELRDRMTAIRRGIQPAERYAASEAMTQRLCTLPEYKNAQTVFAFASMADEVQIDSLIERCLADGKRIAIPWIPRRGVMEAVEVPSLSCLEIGFYGIRNVPAALRTIVNPEEIDLAVVPGAAFAEDGARLGLGGGYYDRYLGLRATRAQRIALTFDALVLPNGTIPMEPHDIRVDAICTETRVFPCR